MAEQRVIGGNAVRGRARIWVPLVAVGVLLMVAAVEVLANRSLPAREALEPGTVVAFGPERAAEVELDEAWEVDRAQTKLDLRVVLARDGTTVVLDAVQFPDPDGTDPQRMWEGVSRLLETAEYSGSMLELGPPAAFATPNIEDGLRGDLRLDDQTGALYVLPSADHGHAVNVRVLSTADASAEDRTAAAALVDSIAFTGEAA
ncbi:hypothetical protein LO763_21405 [Glycomyces sp. A-F 0318]|uniref:hypothetical protein n=1 Tax=Glycomyces amatae TaxID=2881355 RepID=UPI001E30BEB7|nr:hypothetical protein [Glycomyces amatae]MCD0446174.1 hypothetical protein [Glycomyces amatae]